MGLGPASRPRWFDVEPKPSALSLVILSRFPCSGGNSWTLNSSEEKLLAGCQCCPFDLLADTKKEHNSLPPKKNDISKSTSNSPPLPTIVDNRKGDHSNAFRRCKCNATQSNQALKKRKLTVAGRVEGNVRLKALSICKPASLAMASNTGISRMYWSENPCVAS